MAGCAEMMGASFISCSFSSFEMLLKTPRVFFPEVTQLDSALNLLRKRACTHPLEAHSKSQLSWVWPSSLLLCHCQEHLSLVDCMWVHSLRGIWGRSIPQNTRDSFWGVFDLAWNGQELRSAAPAASKPLGFSRIGHIPNAWPTPEQLQPVANPTLQRLDFVFSPQIFQVFLLCGVCLSSGVGREPR